MTTNPSERMGSHHSWAGTSRTSEAMGSKKSSKETWGREECTATSLAVGITDGAWGVDESAGNPEVALTVTLPKQSEPVHDHALPPSAHTPINGEEWHVEAVATMLDLGRLQSRALCPNPRQHRQRRGSRQVATR